jgi:foldase protein PrsA
MRFHAVRKSLAAGVVVALLLLVLGYALGCGSSGAAGLAKDAMAQVGGVTITQDQYSKELADVEKQLGSRVPDKQAKADDYKAFERQVLDYMVTILILQQKQAALNVSVPDAVVQAQIDKIRAMFGGDEAKYQDALKVQNMTEDELRANLGEQLLLQGVRDAVAIDATVTTAEVQSYYAAHKDEYKVSESRLTSHILFAPVPLDSSTTATQADWDAAKARADKVRKQITSGADFAQMAKENSDDAGTKDLGGSLGEVQRGTMVAEFEEAAFALAVNKVSEPVKTESGYHLILVTQVTPASTQTFDEVKDQIGTQLLDAKRQQAWLDWLAKAKKELAVTYKDGWTPEVTATTKPASGAGGTAASTSSASTTAATTTTSQ